MSIAFVGLFKEGCCLRDSNGTYTYSRLLSSFVGRQLGTYGRTFPRSSTAASSVLGLYTRSLPTYRESLASFWPGSDPGLRLVLSRAKPVTAPAKLITGSGLDLDVDHHIQNIENVFVKHCDMFY